MVDIDPTARLYSVRFRRKDLRYNKRDDKLERLRTIAGIRDTSNILDLIKEAERTQHNENKSNSNIYKDHQTIVDINHFRMPSVHIKLTPDQVTRLRKDKDIRWIELADLPRKAFAETIPWGISRVGADQVSLTTHHKGYGVKTCVIDTGTDYNHQDLKPNYKGGVSFVPGVSSPMDDDVDYHGTHVSGTILAAENNADVVGVAPQAWLYAAKVLDKNGSGTTGQTAQGIVWANTNNMDVMNLSLGGTSTLQDESDAIQLAYTNNRFVCCAAGNDGKRMVEYPANYSGAYAIGATDITDTIATFSTWFDVGYVDFTAPGVDIESDLKGGGTQLLNGTSMATPHVSGIYALGLSNYRFSPCDTAVYAPQYKKLAHIVGAMITTCDTMGHSAQGVQTEKYGFGMPQVPALLDKLMPQ